MLEHVVPFCPALLRLLEVFNEQINDDDDDDDDLPFVHPLT